MNVNPIIESVNLYSKPWLSQEISDSLEWVSQNMVFDQKPLFLINTAEPTMAEMIDLWDNAIGAYIGPHYTYEGPIANLVKMRMTIFGSTQCNSYSQKYFNELKEDGILSSEGLNRTILLLDNFYDFEQYENPYLNHNVPGISSVNFEKLWTDRNLINDTITLEGYSDVFEKVGPWYGISRNWSSRAYVLELYSNITNQETARYSFYIYDSAYYSIKVRLFDFDGYNNSVDFKIDQKVIKNLNYTGTEQPLETEIATAYLSNGWHDISIQLRGIGEMLIDLDYISIQYEKALF